VDAPLPHFLAMRVAIVGRVPQQFVGPPARPARLATDVWDGIHHGLQLGNVRSIGGTHGGPQRDAVTVHHGVVLTPFLSAIGGTWAGFFTTTPRPDERAIHRRPRPVDLVRALQLGQQHGMETVPDAGAIPRLEPAAAAIARRIPDKQTLTKETAAWEKKRNGKQARSIGNSQPPTLARN
jgi:hypothetical protein